MSETLISANLVSESILMTVILFLEWNSSWQPKPVGGEGGMGGEQRMA